MPRNMSIDEQLKGLSSHTPAMDASDNVAAVGSRHGSINEASPYPATITEGFLWLGDHKHASTDGVMRDLKITHVVDAAHDDPAGEIHCSYEYCGLSCDYHSLKEVVTNVTWPLRESRASDLSARADEHLTFLTLEAVVFMLGLVLALVWIFGKVNKWADRAARQAQYVVLDAHLGRVPGAATPRRDGVEVD